MPSLLVILLSLALQILPSRYSPFLPQKERDRLLHPFLLILLIDYYFLLQTWNCLSDGVCTRTFRQHSDYVTCLAGAEKNVKHVSILQLAYILCNIVPLIFRCKLKYIDFRNTK